jgi:hypothetical protein
MTRMILVGLVVIGLMIGGCSKEWMAHDTIYKTNDHLAFSLWGYDNPTQDDLKDQTDQGGWWGETIEID